MNKERTIEVISGLLEKAALKMSASDCKGYFYDPEKPVYETKKQIIDSEIKDSMWPKHL